MTAPAPVRFHAAGRRVPKRAPALRFGAVRRTTPAGVLPAIPDSLDYLAHLSDWQLFANDTIGDCAAITWANDRRLITTGLTATPAYPSLEDVLAVYRTQNPQFDPAGDPALNGPGSPADGGMDLQTLLEYLHSNGGPDGVAPVAFASVDVTNEEELSAAVAIFGNLWLGILVQDAQQEQFAAGQPWSWVDGSPVEGGHAVLAGGYDPASKKVVTWGQEVSLEGAGFLGGALEEAWVVIWPEHLGSVGFLTGVDLGQLASSYEALTGRSLPLPPTPVIPSPVTPAPVVDPEPVVPIVDPVPVPDPVVDPAPVVDPSPAPEPAPVVVDPAPVPDPAPAPLDPPVTPEPVTPDPEPVPAPVEPDPVIVDPAPVVDPAPAVDPIPAPVDPTPVVDPAPVDPEPVVDPSPVVDPAPVEPDPVDPSPQPEPTPDPEPVVDPEPEPEPTPEPEPVVDPEPPLPDALRDYPWKAADAFVRNPHHPLAAERFRGKLLEWAATLPV